MYKRVLLVTGSEPMEVNVMTLATADKKGLPSSRIVLLKGVDARGFIFFTNYGSRKGQELGENPNAALTVYSADLERQVSSVEVSLNCHKTNPTLIFKLDPVVADLGAWASRQSYVVPAANLLKRSGRN